jgi:hypothetical protein
MALINVKRCSDSRPEGAWLGNSSTGYVGFFGTDTTVQQSAGSTVTLVGHDSTNSSMSAADRTSLRDAINVTNASLKLYGLLK